VRTKAEAAAVQEEEQPSLVLTISCLGMAVGSLFGLGVVIGSRWPDAVDRYDPGEALAVIVRLGLAVGVMALVVSLAVVVFQALRRTPVIDLTD
jgi:hypothetical protein